MYIKFSYTIATWSNDALISASDSASVIIPGEVRNLITVQASLARDEKQSSPGNKNGTQSPTMVFSPRPQPLSGSLRMPETTHDIMWACSEKKGEDLIAAACSEFYLC